MRSSAPRRRSGSRPGSRAARTIMPSKNTCRTSASVRASAGLRPMPPSWRGRSSQARKSDCVSRSEHSIAAAKAEELSRARYEAGRDSYLALLVAQRTLYLAQQQLVTTRLAEQGNRVALYKALGGGWRETTS